METMSKKVVIAYDPAGNGAFTVDVVLEGDGEIVSLFFNMSKSLSVFGANLTIPLVIVSFP